MIVLPSIVDKSKVPFVIVPEVEMPFKLLHPAKQLPPNNFTDSGILISSNDKHFSKLPQP